MAVVYGRNLNGRILTLAASGWTWLGVFVLQDKETRSLWYPGERDGLVCVAGPLQDARLPQLEFVRLAWKSWITGYPHSSFALLK